MAIINHFIQNRPVHLARRDIYYEAAVKELRKKKASLAKKDYDEILFLLKVARLHAKFSVRTPGENEHNEQFSRFISLLAGNINSILSMLELRDLVLQDGPFDFIGANKANIGIQAEEYQRRADDINRSLLTTLNLAVNTFNQLKEDNAKTLTKQELDRYNKACEHVKKLMEKDQHRYALAPSLGKLSNI